MNKKYKYVELEEVDKYLLTSWKLSKVVKILKNLQIKYGTCRNLTMTNCSGTLYLYGERLETDDEFEKRKKRSENGKASAKKRKANKIASEKQLLKELKKKYE